MENQNNENLSNKELLVKSLDIFYTQEKNAAHNESLVSVYFIICELLKMEEVGKFKNGYSETFNFKDFDICEILKKNFSRLETLETKTQSPNLRKKISAEQKEILRNGRILTTNILRWHGIFNGILAYITDHKVKDGYYNYWEHLNKVRKDGKIEKDDFEILDYYNKYRNIIAHSTGMDFVLNLNSLKLSAIRSLSRQSIVIMMNLLYKNMNLDSKAYSELKAFAYSKVYYNTNKIAQI